MSDFLSKMYALTQERVSHAQKIVPPEALKNAEFFHRAPSNPIPAFQNSGYNIIAEVKFASPSEGDIHAPCEPAAIAAAYVQAGAAMLSVLTEPHFFKGSLAFLSSIRAALSQILLLRKDFIISPYQLLEARAAGADAVLLILALTGEKQTADLYAEAVSLGLTPLVEVHDRTELQAAIDFGARMIGVNNRNLKTLKTDLKVSRALAPLKPKNTVFICESGLETAKNVHDMRTIGFDGFLMGTHFMKQKDPGTALCALKKELSCM